jgi:hypothetical protein
MVSEYAVLAKDRDGKKKSGLSLLLRLGGAVDPGDAPSDWDRNDWRCSGFVKIPDPGARLTPGNQEILRLRSMQGVQWMTALNLEQTRARSVMVWGAWDKVPRSNG